jgi:hypothetical protein
MAEVYINTNSPTATKILFGGEIINADGDYVMATVYDITEDPAVSPLVDPEVPVLSVEATKIETDNGSYKINIPYHLTNRIKKFKVNWGYEINNEAESHATFVDVVQPYCNIAEAIEDLGFGTDPSDPNYKTYHDLVMAEKYARKVIENYTGQKFCLYDDVQIAYGSGSDILPLPFKLNTLHELYSNDILLVDTLNEVNNWNYTTQLAESGFGIRINRADMLDNTVYTANGMVPPSINDSGSGVFIKDYRYRVQGRYGWDTVPDDIQIACVELMKDYFSKDSVWRAKYVNNVQSFDWKFEYNAEAYRGTGNVYVDQILLPYVITQLMVI